MHFQNLHYTSLESITPFFFEHTVSDFSAKAVVYLMFVNSVDLLHTRSVLSPTVKILSSEGKKHSLQAPRKKKKKGKKDPTQYEIISRGDTDFYFRRAEVDVLTLPASSCVRGVSRH